MLQLGKTAYKKFTSTMNSTQSLFILFVRVYWGWQFAQTGWGKLHNLQQVTEYFQSLAVPHAHMTAVFASSLEFFGGVLLIVGLGSRLIALPLTANMLAAYYYGDHEALLAFLKEPSKFYAADPYTFLFTAVFVLVFGAGYFSLDHLIFGRKKSNEVPRASEATRPSLVATA